MLPIFFKLKFANAEDEKKAKEFVPDVRNYNIKDWPQSKNCEVLFGCYLESDNIIMTHLNLARGLPKDEKTYIKIKTFPTTENNAKFTTDIIDKKEAVMFALHNQVRLWSYRLY